MVALRSWAEPCASFRLPCERCRSSESAECWRSPKGCRRVQLERFRQRQTPSDASVSFPFSGQKRSQDCNRFASRKGHKEHRLLSISLEFSFECCRFCFGDWPCSVPIGSCLTRLFDNKKSPRLALSRGLVHISSITNLSQLGPNANHRTITNRRAFRVRTCPSGAASSLPSAGTIWPDACPPPRRA